MASLRRIQKYLPSNSNTATSLTTFLQPLQSSSFSALQKHHSLLLVMKKPTLLLYTTAFSFLFFYPVYALFKPNPGPDYFSSSILSPDEQRAGVVRFQQTQVGLGGDKKVMRLSRRFMSGPGSSPPQCISKCGNCTPCKPIHVAVPLGIPVTEEYYPEAWRCNCGNRLYMP